MLSKSWIERSPHIEAPMVGPVNFQVRTGISAPFEPHMSGDDTPKPATPETTVSVPAADFMVSGQ